MKKVHGVLSDVTEKDIKLLLKNPKKFWKNVTAIGDNAFKECFSVLNKIDIPNTVTSIGNYAFANCYHLVEVTIPNTVTDIGSHTFYRCDSLLHISLPDSITEIKDSTFAYCKSLNTIKWPKSLAKIGFASFGNCESLYTCDLPDTIKEIGALAFTKCNFEIKIPDSVKAIGESAFDSFSYGDVKVQNAYLLKYYDNFLQNPQLYAEMVNTYIHGTLIDELVQKDQIHLIQDTKMYAKAHKQYMGDSKSNTIAQPNYSEFTTLCINLGMFSSETIKFRSASGKMVEDKVCNQAFNILQKLLGTLETYNIHSHFHALKIAEPNEEFIRFLSNKTNLDNMIKEELNTQGFFVRLVEWFNDRKNLNITPEAEQQNIPTTEENRYKVLVYETTSTGVDKLRWREPTIENLMKEFRNKKFLHVTSQTQAIAEAMEKQPMYEQKHFDKAVEIDDERRKLQVPDHITSTPVKQTIDQAWRDYFEKTEQIRTEILENASEIVNEQGEIAEEIFTYEMLAKSDPANFCMGFHTSCCATLFGAGAGAQKGMIISPNMQPLTIKDNRGDIIAFGIVYVNRNEQYAVVNDFEVNKRYESVDPKIRKAIYKKAMEGIDAFVRQYNKEQEESKMEEAKPIKMVTCGLSPNWQAINDYISQHPESEILEAPNFDDFKYAGSGSWSGDWHKGQYLIWQDNGISQERSL